MKVNVETLTEQFKEDILRTLRKYPYLEITESRYLSGEYISDEVEGMHYGSLWQDFVVNGEIEEELVKERLLIYIEKELSINIGKRCYIDSTEKGAIVFQIGNPVIGYTGSCLFIKGSNEVLDEFNLGEYKSL